MANFADLLTLKSKVIFDSIVKEEEDKKRKIAEEQENAERRRYAVHGFKSYDSLFNYLKTTGRRVYVDFSDYGIYLQWSDSKNRIRHQVYENNDIDMTIGYADIYYTEEEFLKKFSEPYDDKGINKFGYVDRWLSNESHSIENYKEDDRFFFNL